MPHHPRVALDNLLNSFCRDGVDVSQCVDDHKIGFVRIVVAVEGFMQGPEVTDYNVAILSAQ